VPGGKRVVHLRRDGLCRDSGIGSRRDANDREDGGAPGFVIRGQAWLFAGVGDIPILAPGVSRYCGTPYGRKAFRANLQAVKPKRLTPFSGSLFRLTLSLIGGAAVLAAVFLVVERAPVIPLRKSTGSFDHSAIAGSLSAGDQRFLEQAVALHRDELAQADLALRQAADQRVRDYAFRLQLERRRATEELGHLAAARGVVAQAERGGAADLARAAPRAFDGKFLTQIVAAHAEAADLFERAATQCDDPALRAFALRRLPTLQAQHTEVKQLRKNLG
jgi:putative membrane protein